MTNLIYSESFINFLQETDNKICRTLIRLQYKNRKSNLVNDDFCNYITFRPDGQISYLPKGKALIYDNNGNWKRDNRQASNAGKLIKKIMHPRLLKCFKDTDFENFVNCYKSKFSNEGFTMRIEPNTNIRAVYNAYQIKDGGGNLNGSCMNGDDYQHIYTNCEQLSILTLKNKDGLLCGRAFLWKIDEYGEQITLLDRVYVTDDHLFETFISYAQDNNFWYKKYYKTYGNKQLFINPNGEEVCRTFVIETDTDFDYYPYIDTFTFGGDGYLTNNEDDEDNIYTYTDTGGDREQKNREAYDDIDGCYIDIDDSITVEAGTYDGQTTHRDNTVEVDGLTYWKNDNDICQINGDYYLIDDCVYSDYHNEYILCSDAVEVCGNYYYKNDVCEC